MKSLLSLTKKCAMLDKLHNNRPFQLLIGLVVGIFFGFFLQKGQVTKYDAIVGQLLLMDFTVLKVMLTAIIVGMPGIYAMRAMGLVKLEIKPGSLGATGIGGLIFGAGMGILGYCPGTTTGATGQGSLDALVGGIGGMLVGGMIYARLYPKLSAGILNKGDFGTKTFPEWLRMKVPAAIALFILIGLSVFAGLEIAGL